MPRITAIKPQKKSNRRNIYLDGRFAFGVSTMLIVKEKLKVGDELSLEKVKKLSDKNNLEKYLDMAYRYLSYRPRSIKEMVDYLQKKKISTPLTEKILLKLKKQRYLDDLKFAYWWLDQRARFRPRGKFALTMELREKGLKNDLIKSVLTEKVSEEELALKAARKKIKSYRRFDKKEKKKKLKSFLARQGFGWPAIKIALEAVLDKKII